LCSLASSHGPRAFTHTLSPHDALPILLLAAGAAGKRHALPHSRVMIHQPLGGYQGQASDIDIHAREILKMKDTLNQILVRHTGQDRKSTRLNSSHVSISYAVFCLKIKK